MNIFFALKQGEKFGVVVFLWVISLQLQIQSVKNKSLKPLFACEAANLDCTKLKKNILTVIVNRVHSHGMTELHFSISFTL